VKGCEVVRVVVWIDGRAVKVKVYFRSRLLLWLQRRGWISGIVEGFAPWNIHMREARGDIDRKWLAHEFIHILDREGSGFPRRILYPIRAWRAQRDGYRESVLEQRAYDHQDAVVAGTWDRVKVSDIQWHRLTIPGAP